MTTKKKRKLHSPEFKAEVILHDPIPNRDEMRQIVFEYIDVDYNRTRRHSYLGYLSPDSYELEKVA